MCSYFFSPILGCLLLSFIVLSCSLPCCFSRNFLFVCFYGSRLFQSIQSLVSIHITLPTGKILNRSAGFTCKLYLHELRPTYVVIEALTRCDKSWFCSHIYNLVEPPTTFSKGEALEGGCWERGVTFFKGVAIFR